MTIINIGTEDEISESVAVRLIGSAIPSATIGLRLRKGGFGYLRANLFKFRQMANREYVLILTDLDRRDCVVEMIREWEGGKKFPERLLMRVPVREIEAWLLADREGMADMLGVSEAKIPADPDALSDPKQALLNVAKSARRDVRSELLIAKGSISSQGIGYNRTLSEYVRSIWEIDRARQRSPSLDRAIKRLLKLGLAG
jgi:hypothetical protein